MIPELGHLALILALCLAAAQSVFGLAGAFWRRAEWMAVVRPAVAGQFVFVALAFGCLTAAFLGNDFSVNYVALNSNSALPAFYRVAAVWGAHEGSLLLWILVLATWSLAVAALSRSLPDTFIARVLGVLGLISAGFMTFTLATSNPFTRLMPPAGLAPKRPSAPNLEPPRTPSTPSRLRCRNPCALRLFALFGEWTSSSKPAPPTLRARPTARLEGERLDQSAERRGDGQRRREHPATHSRLPWLRRHARIR